MKLQLKVPDLNRRGLRLSATGQRLLLGTAGLLASLVLISCVATKTTLVAPPQIAGAKFVGSDACVECHETVTKPFKTAVHAQLRAKGTNSMEMGCESCHGAGSVHVDAGGGRGNIINPRRSPQVCFDCHLDKRGEFNLPFHHPVL